MFNEIARIIIGFSILLILFFAYMKKDMLPKLVSFTILASIAFAMIFTSFARLISDVDFLNFLESIFRTLADLVVFVEIVVILFLLFFSKFKTKVMVIKVVIIVYVVLVALLAFGVFR
ncbi:MAG: hypothetical protein Q7I99_03975 [Acholeplasmataceae bacterium]|nr:hypothetical protein [Acholeplasmataceae bacterium]